MRHRRAAWRPPTDARGASRLRHAAGPRAAAPERAPRPHDDGHEVTLTLTLTLSRSLSLALTVTLTLTRLGAGAGTPGAVVLGGWGQDEEGLAPTNPLTLTLTLTL